MFLAWKVDSRLEDDLVFAAPSLWAAVMVEETTVGILVAAGAVVLEADCDTYKMLNLKNVCLNNLLKMYRCIHHTLVPPLPTFPFVLLPSSPQEECAPPSELVSEPGI